MEKNSFILYTEFYEAIKDLTDAQIGQLHRAIYIYIAEDKIITLEPILSIAFKFIKNNLNKQKQAKQAKVENGKKGGAKKGNQNARKKKSIDNYEEKQPKQPKTTKNNQKQPKVFKEEKEEKKEKEKERTKEKDNNNINIIIKEKKEEDSQTQQPSAPAIVKPLNSQQRVYEYFAGKYKALTGIKYLSKRSEFINLTELIHSYGEDMVCQKIEWLEVGCRNAVFWFAKNISDFTIGTLVKHWNKIIPIKTEEQKKAEEEKRKEEERMKRVLAEAQKLREERSK